MVCGWKTSIVPSSLHPGAKDYNIKIVLTLALIVYSGMFMVSYLAYACNQLMDMFVTKWAIKLVVMTC